MARSLRLIGVFLRSAVQAEMAYRVNFWIHLLYTGVNLVVAWVGLAVVFGQVPVLRGWDYTATLALLGVYLVVSALREVCLGPSLNALAGMDGELWTGRFDFTLLKPVDVQFLASFRQWRPFALVDLALGLAVVGRAVLIGGDSSGLTLGRVGLFLLALGAGVVLIYAVLLLFSALVFWHPGLLYTWVFDALFQLARYPVGIYPPWLRVVLTWMVPVAFITTVPAEALTGKAALGPVLAGVAVALLAVIAASALFRSGVRRYASASS